MSKTQNQSFIIIFPPPQAQSPEVVSEQTPQSPEVSWVDFLRSLPAVICRDASKRWSFTQAFITLDPLSDAWLLFLQG